MRYLNVEDRSQMDEQKTDDELLEMAQEQLRVEAIDTLTYNNYRWQREFHGLAAERLAKIFPRADKYEARYQEEQKRAA